MNNKEIYMVYTECYNDVSWHGYFETKQEAKDYCDWRNKYAHDDWDRYWYSEVKPMNIQEEKEGMKVVYRVKTDKFLIDTVEAKLRHKDSKDNHCMKYYPKDYYYGNEEETYSFVFFIETNSEDKARKIAYDLMAQVKEKYVECEDWELAMDCIGGYVF